MCFCDIPRLLHFLFSCSNNLWSSRCCRHHIVWPRQLPQMAILRAGQINVELARRIEKSANRGAKAFWDDAGFRGINFTSPIAVRGYRVGVESIGDHVGSDKVC